MLAVKSHLCRTPQGCCRAHCLPAVQSLARSPAPPAPHATHCSQVGQFGAMQLAIQAATSSAFKNPEVIRMMGKREPGQLRSRIGDLDAAVSIGKMTVEARDDQVVEILTAIRKLGGKISAEEGTFLEAHGNDALNSFETVSSELAGVKAMSLAGSAVTAAK